MSSNNNQQQQHEEAVCVGTIIDENSHQNDAYAWQQQQNHHHHVHHPNNNNNNNNSNIFSQTLPSFHHHLHHQPTSTHNNHNITIDNRTGQQQVPHFYPHQPQYHLSHNTSGVATTTTTTSAGTATTVNNQNVVYATNPLTGETVMFPVIPAMFAPPNHQRGSPTYEFHQGSTTTFQPNMIVDHHHSLSPPPAAAPNSKIWSTGLFECFDDTDGCLEAWCCGRCQLSRQYGFTSNGKKDIDLFSFFFSVVIDVIAGPTGIVALTWYTRRAIRQRYGIIGSDCSDCFAAVCCGPCATHQQYRQMSIEGEWPTGCCVSNVYSLPSNHPMRRAVVVPTQEMGQRPVAPPSQQQQQQQRGGTIHQGELIVLGGSETSMM